MQEQINQLQREIEQLKAFIYKDNFEGIQVFRKDSSFTGKLNIDGKVGFFKVTPVSQQATITTPSGGGGSTGDAVDQSARVAIGQIKTALTNIGITA